MGFQVVKGDAQSHGYLTDKKQLPIFQERYQKIQVEATAHNPNFSSDYHSKKEFKMAFKDKRYDYYRRRIIAQHPTEWQGLSYKNLVDMLKLTLVAENDQTKLADYKYMDKDFGKSNIKQAQAMAIFFHEQERIKELAFWNDVPELTTKMPFHVHPIALVGNARMRKFNKLTWADSPFAELLGKVESKNDYTAYNRTYPKPKRGSFYNTNLMSFTISEVMEKQKKREMFATGRFQIITGTLNEAVNYLNLDTTRKYNKEVQDVIFDYLIRKKRPSIINYLEGDGDIEIAIYDWAKEFASAGVRKGKKISQGRVALQEGVSYYAGDGLNRAHIKPDEMVEVLKESKKNAHLYTN